MPASPEQPRRRRFLKLRIALFLLSLPLVVWAVTRYGSSAAGYVQTYTSLTGFWFWFWTLLLVWATWAVWRLVKRKWARARELASELDVPRR